VPGTGTRVRCQSTSDRAFPRARIHGHTSVLSPDTGWCGDRSLERDVRVGTPPSSCTPGESDAGSFACLVCNQGRHRRFTLRVRWGVHPEPAGDANADANWESDPVGCCRSGVPERIQETVPDGASQASYAFWKCGWGVTRHEVRIPLAPHFPYEIRHFYHPHCKISRPSRLTRGSSDANGDADHPARACARCQTDDAGLRPSRPGDHGPARPMRARFAQRIDGGAPQRSISREWTI
jgi:hypothetical protein